jgi:CheY-like chemotaxis protein
VSVRVARVLVVSDSAVLRDFLRLVLLPHAADVVTAGSRKQARERLASDLDLELVICDGRLPDSTGLVVLCDVVAHGRPRPEVILVTSHPDAAERRRALELGAIGYLPKPISFLDIARVLRQHSGDWRPQRELRRRPGARASLVDPGAAPGAGGEIFWYVRDLSASGAFLETESPIPPGTRLELALELGSERLAVSALVIRVQEPAWGRTPGVGIRFVELDPATRERIGAYVAEEPIVPL